MPNDDQVLDILRNVPQFASEAGLARLAAAQAHEASALAAAIAKGSKLGVRTVAAPGRSVGHKHYVDPLAIHIKKGFNLRDDTSVKNAEHVLETGQSIAAIGLKKPIDVYWDEFDQKVYVVDGHCRLRATWHAIDSLGAEIALIPVMEMDGRQSDIDHFVHMMASGGSLPPSQLEKAAKIKEIHDRSGLTIGEIAARIGVPEATISDWLKNASRISMDINKLINLGKISYSAAVSAVEDAGGNTKKALADILKAVAISEKDRNSKGRILPRHLSEARTGKAPVPVRAEIRGMFKSREIQVHNDGEMVAMHCPSHILRKLFKIIELDDEGVDTSEPPRGAGGLPGARDGVGPEDFPDDAPPDDGAVRMLNEDLATAAG